jgi:hypothetical protein
MDRKNSEVENKYIINLKAGQLDCNMQFNIKNYIIITYYIKPCVNGNICIITNMWCHGSE